ncbi:hypothetical protein HAX54_008147 [Datura stramonium]|uniref:Uncharacterized protein n=1 Tax=Datura stramonium TaxID=4076 RepID=A0ABS8RV63_DATST|nr:hypothetical protein [Datura stramonium]
MTSGLLVSRWIPDIVQTTRKDSLKSSMIEESTASPEVQDDSIKSPLKKDNKINCYASESVYSPSPSACSVPQCHADNGSVSASAAKDDYTELVNQLDSESSTTQVEILYNFSDLKEDLAMAKTSALTTSQI